MMRSARLLFVFAALMLSIPGFAQPAPVTVWIQTSMGDIAVELDAGRAPRTVANFLRYVNEGLYDGTVVYRVMPGYIVQMGSVNADGSPRPVHEPIPLEMTGLSNLRGTLAMARDDEPDTAKAEFFINLSDNTTLDPDPAAGRPGYAVFGRVVYGMEVVEAMTTVELGGPGPFPDNAPAMPISIHRIVPAP